MEEKEDESELGKNVHSSPGLPFHGAWLTSGCHGQPRLNVPSLLTSEQPGGWERQSLRISELAGIG